MAQHITLLGDSIFDNGAYTNGLPDVLTHLTQILPAGTTATLLAADGSTTHDVLAKQIPKIPSDVTHAAISMGGNDAIVHADALDLPVSTTAEALAMFGERASQFEASYRRTIETLVERVPRTIVCTIYNARLPGEEARLARVGLMLFNDVILRVAFDLRLPVADLRLVVTDPDDYANALEPSSRGAEKIASAIAAALGFADSTQAVSTIWAHGGS